MKSILIGFGGCSASGKSINSSLIHSLLRDSNSAGPVLLIHQDSFFKPDSLIPLTSYTYSDASSDKEVVECANWDSIQAIDFDGFHCHLKSLKSISNLLVSPTIPAVSSNRPSVDEFVLATLLKLPAVISLIDEIHAIVKHTHTRLVLVDGFLLYSMPETLELIDLALFFHAPIDVLRARRAARADYKTIEGVWRDPPAYFDKVVWREYLTNNALVLEDSSSSSHKVNVVRICTDPTIASSLHVVTCILNLILDRLREASNKTC